MQPSSDTIVARFEFTSDGLTSATTSAELIAALREHLALDLAMPLDAPIRVSLRGMVGRGDGTGQPYHFGLSTLGVGYRGDAPLEDYPYAEAVRESHGDDFPPDDDDWDEFGGDDWQEDAAWGDLVEALDLGLPQSFEEFGQPGPGAHVPLRVRGVHTREFTLASDADWMEFGACCEGEFGPAILRLRPDLQFQAAMAEEESAEPVRRVNVIFIELEPASESGPPTAAGGPAPADAAAPADPDAEALELSQMILSACEAGSIQGHGTVDAALDGERWTGNATYRVGDDGAMIILGAFDEGLDRCLVLVRGGGGPLTAGTYPIQMLSEERVFQEEVEPGGGEGPSFFAAMATDMDASSTVHMGPHARIVVVTGGTMEISSVGPMFQARFDLRGWITPALQEWIADGSTGGTPVTTTGSLEAEPITR